MSHFYKSSASVDVNCVEVSICDESVSLRDSKNPRGPVLRFYPAEWEAFLTGVRRGEFDLAPGSPRGSSADG